MPASLDKMKPLDLKADSRKAPPGEGPATKHDQVYRALRDALITGRIVPGRGVTLRGLAGTLGVSAMPVREALRRIAAEGGLEVRANRRVYVPDMDAERFEEMISARSLLEPEAAARALPFITAERIRSLEAIDRGIDTALETGDVEAYMAGNHAFHFAIYTAAPSSVFVPVIENLWLQFGPFMRAVYGRVGTAIVVDQHERALAAMRARDAEALKAAIRADILDGMSLIGTSVLAKASA